MMGNYRRINILFIFCCFIFVTLRGSSAENNNPKYLVQKTDNKPVIDGSLNDLCWGELLSIKITSQYDPENGKDASEETYVKMCYDDNNIYFAFDLKDREAKKIYAELTPRNGYVNNDSITVYLDTYNDHRTYFAFQLNPLGIQSDSVETIWQGSARRSDTGWTAEMAIPYKSLRFSKEKDQTWGVVFQRYIHRLKETDIWPSMTRDDDFLLKSGQLVGMMNISAGHNLEFFPYFGARYSKWEGSVDKKIAGGLDVKYGLASNLVLDITASPDYSEVESDPFIYQLSPYEVRMTDYRPFFSEGSQYFQTPQFTMFYSRRISDPRVATKVTGKVNDYSFGVLVADNQTSGADEVFSIFRLKKDIFKNSSIGIYYTSLLQGEERNQNLSFDFSVYHKNIYTIEGQVVYSFNKGMAQNNNGMYYFKFKRSPDAGISYGVNYLRVGNNVDVKTGYVYQKDTQNTDVFAGYSWRFSKKRIKKVYINFDGSLNTDCSNMITSKGFSFISTINFRNRSSITTNCYLSRSKYQVYQGNDLVWTNGFYPYDGISFSYYYNSGGYLKGYNLDFTYNKEGVYQDDYTRVEDGYSYIVSAGTTFRPKKNFEIICKFGHTSQFTSANDKLIFNGTTYSISSQYQISKGWFVSVDYKGESRFRQYNFNCVLGYNWGAGNILQIIYKRRRLCYDTPVETGNSIIVKLSYLLRL